MAQNETPITVVGNVVAEPELRWTPAGAAVCNFRVASTPKRFNSQTQQWEDGEAMFLTCNAWKHLAENTAESLAKGMRVIVNGRLKQRSFQTREGDNRTVFEIDVDEVGPSLRYATAQVNRNPREGGNNFGGGGQQRSNNNNQGGFGCGQQQQPQQNQAPSEDPWNSAPPAGGFGGADSEPPF